MGNLGMCAALAAMLGACAMQPAGAPGTGSDPGSGGAPTVPDTADPTTCAQSMTLGPSEGSSAPVVLTTDSIGWCLHLTGVANVQYDLFATTANEAADASSFQIVLDDTTGANLETGWDVSVGETNAQTHASLEDTTLTTPADVILRARALATPGATTLSVTLELPLD